MLLSIIISVYNLEAYIVKCLSTLVAQEFADYEVIIVDDGSTDQSPYLCSQYATNNPQIKYFRKNNGGASSARNFGLDKASGIYVVFMDGDDFLEGVSSFRQLHTKAKESPDFVIFGCCDYDNLTEKSNVSRTNYGIANTSKLSKKNVIKKLIEDDNFPGAAWLFCVKKEFLLHHQIKFKESVKAEDLDWIFSVFQHADKKEDNK